MDGRQSKRARSKKASSSSSQLHTVPTFEDTVPTFEDERSEDKVEETRLLKASKIHDRIRDAKGRNRIGATTARGETIDGESSKHVRGSDKSLATFAAQVQVDSLGQKQRRKKRKASEMRSRSQSDEAALDSHVENSQISQEVGIEKTIEEDVENTSAAAQIKALQLENARLEQEIALKDDVVNVQRETIAYFYGQCTCTICMEMVWRPHVLSPCGHVFCAHCLVAWFTKPSPNEHAPPLHPGDDPREAERRRTLRRVKVCPHCREKVAVAPVEVWLIKGLLERIDASMRKGEGNDDHLVQGNDAFQALSLQEQREAKGLNLPASKSIWKDIFSEFPQDEPMYDEEDRVYRCTLCLNEVVDGLCTQCLHEYSTDGMNNGADADLLDDLLDEEYSLNSGEEYDDMDEEDFAFIDDFPHPSAAHLLGHGHGSYDDDEDDDDDEYGEGTLPGHSLSNSTSNSIDDDDDDDDDGIQEVDDQGRPIGARRLRVILSDSEDDDDDNDNDGASQGTITHITIASDDEEEEEDDDDDVESNDQGTESLGEYPEEYDSSDPELPLSSSEGEEEEYSEH